MNERLNMGGGGQKRVERRAETAARAIAARAVKMFPTPSLWLNIFHSDLDLRPLLPSRMQIPSIPHTTSSRRPTRMSSSRAACITYDSGTISLFALRYTQTAPRVPLHVRAVIAAGFIRRSSLDTHPHVARGMESLGARRAGPAIGARRKHRSLDHRRRCRGLRGQTCQIGLGGQLALPSVSAVPLGSHRGQCCHKSTGSPLVPLVTFQLWVQETALRFAQGRLAGSGLSYRRASFCGNDAQSNACSLSEIGQPPCGE